MAPAVFMGSRYQKGHGFGSILKAIGKVALPVLRNTALPFLKKTGKRAVRNAGRFALQSGKNIAGDIVQGKTFKESVKARGQEGMQRTVRSILRKRKSRSQSSHRSPTKKAKKNSRKSKSGRKKVSKSPKRDIFV